MPTVHEIRSSAWHYLNPNTAAAANLTIPQMQQFCAGSFTPTPVQLQLLAAAMGMLPGFKLTANV